MLQLDTVRELEFHNVPLIRMPLCLQVESEGQRYTHLETDLKGGNPIIESE